MIEWFNRVPGDLYIKPTYEEDPYGEQMILMGVGAPDWVQIPQELGPPLAGMQLRVVGSFAAPCPTCKAGGAKHLKLEHVDPDRGRLYTSECTACRQFTFYFLKEISTPPSSDCADSGTPETPR